MSKQLEGRRILVCVSASIAAYKSIYVIRELVKNGAHVSVAVTNSTSQFVGNATFSAVASEPVYDDLWSNRGSIAHTQLGKSADLVLVVPATASIIAKMANGIADDIVSASLLCVPKETPIIVAPAMHSEMFEHQATQENISILKQRDIDILGPISGELAGKDSGIGRLVEPSEIVERVIKKVSSIPKHENVEVSVNALAQSFKSKPLFLVTAGGTREPIDPVRVITNRSSGKMGHAIANAALQHGYRVVLITTSNIESAPEIERIDVETANEMLSAVEKHLGEADIVMMTAAVADVAPANPSMTKLKRSEGIKSIDLVDTPDIISEIVANKKSDTFVACFAAESNNVIENAAKKYIDKNVDMLVANDISRSDSGFGCDTNKVWIFSNRSIEPRELELLTKDELAYELLELIITQTQLNKKAK